MSLKQKLKEVLAEVDELERDARRYRDGEVCIDLGFTPHDVANALKEFTYPDGRPKNFKLVVEFAPHTYDVDAKSYGPIKYSMRGFQRILKVLEEVEG